MGLDPAWKVWLIGLMNPNQFRIKGNHLHIVLDVSATIPPTLS